MLSGTNDLSAPDPNQPLPIDLQMNDLSISPLLEVQPTPVLTSQEPCPSPVVSSAASSCHNPQPYASTPFTSTARSTSPTETPRVACPELPVVANPCQFLVENFSHFQSRCKIWYSPPFYTHTSYSWKSILVMIVYLSMYV